MKIGISVRSEKESYFIKKRYLKYFKDYEIILLYPYINTHAYEMCDGFVVIGGGDFNPKIYGENNIKSVNIDDEIDELDLSIINYAVTNNKPLFGICRGLQTINIYFGGTLKQNILNHQKIDHKIILVDNFYDFPDAEIVNSYHHQSVLKLGRNLRVLYYSTDGEVECFVHPIFPLVALQFHPELDLENPFYRQFLSYFDILLNSYKK